MIRRSSWRSSAEQSRSRSQFECSDRDESDVGSSDEWSASGRGGECRDRTSVTDGQEPKTGNSPQHTLSMQRLSVGEKMHRVVVTGIGVVCAQRDWPSRILRGDLRRAFRRGLHREFRHVGPEHQDRRRGQELRRSALPGRAQEEPEADEPGRAVRRRGGGDGRRGRRSRDRPARPGAVRRLHGGGDHAGGRRRAGRRRSCGASARTGRSTWAGSPWRGPSRSSRSGCSSICPTWRPRTSRSSTTRWARTTRS